MIRSFDIETKRLLLKKMRLSDLDNLSVLRSDPDVMLNFPLGVQNKESVEKFLARAMQHNERYGYGFYSVYEKDTGDFVGHVSLSHLSTFDPNPDTEIGYRLHKKFWGKGYATELATALVQYGFNELLIKKISALITPGNKASVNVAEKIGMRYVGDIQNGGVEMMKYEVTSSFI